MKQAVFNKTAFIPVGDRYECVTVSNVTHGFGARQILDDASFRLLKGEHVGLIGANGEGKSTFLNIITGKIPPDEGKIEWSNQVTVGYLDQHAVLEKGMTIRDDCNGLSMICSLWSKILTMRTIVWAMCPKMK